MGKVWARNSRSTPRSSFCKVVFQPSGTLFRSVKGLLQGFFRPFCSPLTPITAALLQFATHKSLHINCAHENCRLSMLWLHQRSAKPLHSSFSINFCPAETFQHAAIITWHNRTYSRSSLYIYISYPSSGGALSSAYLRITSLRPECIFGASRFLNGGAQQLTSVRQLRYLGHPAHQT